jgi:NADH:ubiquinone oxidoreductase subunit D
MTDRTLTDLKTPDPKAADSTRFLSHLELGEPDKTFLDSNELVINMGPQHPATHGVLRVILKLDGEKVLGTECVIGYLHRGVEKIAEHRTYTMFNPYVDRMDYVAAVSNGLGYCEAVEKLLNIEAPPRAKYIRVILTELNRLASHQLWLGTHALDIGAMTPLFYTFRDREEILKIFEKYCGARLTTQAFSIGGCPYEISSIRVLRILTRKRHWPAADCRGARGAAASSGKAPKASVTLLHEAVEEGRKLRVGITRPDVGNM